MAFVIAPIPAGARSAPQAKRQKGITEFTAGMPAGRPPGGGGDAPPPLPQERQEDQRAERQPRLHQREGAELWGRHPHEEKRSAPDRPEQGEFERGAPEGVLRGGG